MKKVMLALVVALATTTTVLAVDLPGPPSTQSINCQQDGPRACQRLKLLRNLFGPAASTVPTACHFALVSTPELPDPPYRARHLALVCLTGGVWGGGGVSSLYWTDGAKPDGNVVTDQD